MRRADDVFFFTLIDFLLQVFFFGLLLFTLTQRRQAALLLASEQVRADDENRHVSESEKVNKLLAAAGVSNLTELTDELSRLGPVKELKGTADFITSIGGLEKAKEEVDKLHKYEEGSGKPPCLYSTQDGKRVARSLARVRISDAQIAFLGNTQELQEVLSDIGATYATVEQLPLREFRRQFRLLVEKKPECRYQLDGQVATQLLEPVDTVWSAFYIRRR